MRKIFFFDTTLRDGEQTPGVSLTANEKLEIAYQLERLQIDRIEAGFPASSPSDFEAVGLIARHIKNASIAALARCKEADIRAAAEALKKAQEPRIHVFIATSPIHRKHKFNMNQTQILEIARESIRLAKSLVPHVEFSLEDAGRTEMDYLYKVVQMATDEGVQVVNIPDTVGYLTPIEYGRIFENVKKNVNGIEKIQLSCHCHDDLGMATANTLSAILHGADQVEGTINGIGERAGNAALEEVALTLHTRAEYFQAQSTLLLSEITKTSRLISNLTGVRVQPNKAIVGKNAFVHESGIHQDGMLKEKTTYEIISPEIVGFRESTLVLGKHSGRHAFFKHLQELNYDLKEQQQEEIFQEFKTLTIRKKQVNEADIIALVEQKLSMNQVSIFQLKSFTISYLENEIPCVKLQLLKEGQLIEQEAVGNGAVDASFHALNLAIGKNFVLKDYHIESIGSGTDAQGEVRVILADFKKEMCGRGLGTDILKASMQAYLEAAHRLI